MNVLYTALLDLLWLAPFWFIKQKFEFANDQDWTVFTLLLIANVIGIVEGKVFYG